MGCCRVFLLTLDVCSVIVDRFTMTFVSLLLCGSPMVIGVYPEVLFHVISNSLLTSISLKTRSCLSPPNTHLTACEHHSLHKEQKRRIVMLPHQNLTADPPSTGLSLYSISKGKTRQIQAKVRPIFHKTVHLPHLSGSFRRSHVGGKR
jgi:hypothetical protein